MTRTAHSILFLVLLLSSFTSCSGDTDKSVSVTKKDAPEKSFFENSPSDDPSSHEGKSDPHPSKRYLIGFLGRASAEDDRLYMISSRAREGFAEQISRYPTRFFEIVPFKPPDVLFALVGEGKNSSVAQFNVRTRLLYTLLPDEGTIDHLKVSDDGSRIAFIKRELQKEPMLYVYFLETKEMKKIVMKDRETLLSFQFSPDSQSIIVTQKKGDRAAYLDVDLRQDTFGSGALILQKRTVTLSAPVFIKGTNKICFIEMTDTVSFLKIIDLKTLEEQTRYRSEGLFEVSASPNGKFLTFWGHSSEGQRLFAYDISTGALQTVSNLNVPMKGELFYRKGRVHPVWTPDSQGIVYSSHDGWNGQIYKYNMISGETVKLTDNAFYDFYHPIVLGEANL